MHSTRTAARRTLATSLAIASVALASSAGATPAEAPGTVRILASHWARVVIDGQTECSTPCRVRLSAGEHTAVAVESGRKRDVTFLVEAGGLTRIYLDMRNPAADRITRSDYRRR